LLITPIAYTQTETDPDAAVNAIADIVGGTMAEDEGKAQSRSVLDVTLGLLYSNANTDKQLGLHVASDWESMVNLMKEYNDLDPSADPASFYTNEFVN
jgi:NitT/TauT family transport system substrate-binding protein